MFCVSLCVVLLGVEEERRGGMSREDIMSYMNQNNMSSDVKQDAGIS